MSDAERTHLVDRSCLPAGPPDLLVAQRREHVVHHDRVGLIRRISKSSSHWRIPTPSITTLPRS